MNKIFSVTMTIPVTINVSANDDSGEVVITHVNYVDLPSVADIRDSLNDANIEALDDAFVNE